jgi:hypothetical protein
MAALTPRAAIALSKAIARSNLVSSTPAFVIANDEEAAVVTRLAAPMAPIIRTIRRDRAKLDVREIRTRGTLKRDVS